MYEYKVMCQNVENWFCVHDWISNLINAHLVMASLFYYILILASILAKRRILTSDKVWVGFDAYGCI